MQLLMYDKGGFFTIEFSTPEGGLRTIRETELEENNGILKNLYRHFIRDPKGTTYVGFFLQIKSHAKMRWSNELDMKEQEAVDNFSSLMMNQLHG